MSITRSLPPSPPVPPGAPAGGRLSLLMRGFQISRAIQVAVSLGIPDLIADTPRAAGELAVATATDAAALTRLLRCLAAFGLVREVSPGTFVLQDEAAVLRSNHPRSLRPMVLFQGSENYWQTWGALADCVRTGVAANGLLTGDADLYAPPAVLRLFAARIKGSESVIVPEVGHSTYWEQPEIFNKTVMAFIGKHP